MPVTIDINAIVDTLLAGSAVAAVASAVEKPALFTPDHTPALRMACRDALRQLALQLAPYLETVSLDGDSPSFEFCSDLRLPPAAVATMMSDIVASRVLHLMHAATYPSLSAAYARQAADSLAAIHRMIISAAMPRCLKIAPNG